jgi:hypothetical protein
VTSLVRYRADLSHDVRWNVHGVRFMVVTVTAEQQGPVSGVSFEAPDGQVYTFTSAASQAAGEILATRHKTDSTVFMVQPRWSCPADSWIAADSEFWAEVGSANATRHNRR